MILSRCSLSAALSACLALFVPGAVAHAAQQSTEEFLADAPDSAWLPLDPENVLVMELPSGRMYIEMQPRLAPGHVERVRTLTRQGFYDGTIFHRVIEGFMAQGGDPEGTGLGGSELPNLTAEFTHNALMMEPAVIGRDDRAAQVGFIGSVPVGTQAPTLTGALAVEEVALWGLHCPGVMSMARAGDPNSANSQFFVMLGDTRDSLDQTYTVWGNIVAGYQNARRINRGEPPPRPTPIVRMRVLSDLPPEEQVEIEILDPASDLFEELLTRSFNTTGSGYGRSMCNIDLPVRIDGELQE